MLIVPIFMEVRQEDHALIPALPMYKSLVDERVCRKREEGEREAGRENRSKLERKNGLRKTKDNIKEEKKSCLDPYSNQLRH